MADYRLNGADETNGVFYIPESKFIPNSLGNRDWQGYLAWKALGNTPDPQSTPEEQAQKDYNARQTARVGQLKAALITQFKMILALFQVGRQKGIWTVSDFPSELVAIAQEWQALIEEYENDTPTPE